MGNPTDRWIFGVKELFGIIVIGVIFITMVYGGYLIPQFKTIINDDSVGLPVPDEDKYLINARFDKFMFFLKILPGILVLGIIIMMIIAAIRKPSDTRYV